MLRKDEKHPENLLFKLPSELMREVNEFESPPSAALTTLLNYVAHGNQAKVKEILDTTPQLLREAGNVVTPAGNKMLRITPLECAISGGDDEWSP
jgi:hypothetical protein